MKKLTGLVGGVAVVLVLGSSLASAQQVMWKDNPISGKVVGLTYGTSTWAEGESQGIAYGGHLATVRGDAEQVWLTQSFASHWGVGSNNGGPWIGLSDAANEGQWVWADGTPSSWFNWAPGEPNDCCGGQDFANMNVGPLWKWDDGGLGSLRSLIEVGQRPPRSWSWPSSSPTGIINAYLTSADFDADGDMDFVICGNVSGIMKVLYNDGQGSFTAAEVIQGGGRPIAAQPLDIDYDGDLDIVATDLAGGRVMAALRSNQGAYSSVVTVCSVPDAYGLSVGDINGDGEVELVVTSIHLDDRVRVLQRTGPTNFAVVTVLGPIAHEAGSTALGDLDGDGLLDAVVSGGVVRVFRGTSSGTLTAVAGGNLVDQEATHATLIDLDNDGDLDVAVPLVDGNVLRTFRNQGGMDFVPAQTLSCGQFSRWAEACDVDGDGNQDVVVANSVSDDVFIFRNDGVGNLVKDHVFISQDGALQIAVADVNGDAKPDIFTSNESSQQFSIHFNQSIFDCNANGIDDPLDITSGAATDCNSNGRPDSCDLAFGLSQDSDGDGLLNECEPTLISVTPSTLPAFVGGTVTVRGTNIPDGIVRLDLEGVPVNFSMTNNVGTAVIPPLGAPRSSDLTVAGSLRYGSAPGEVTGTTPAVFTWDVPEIVGAVPATGPYDGPTAVVYTLADNTVTTGIGTATFGGAAPQIAHLFSVNGLSKVVTTAPVQATPGPVSVLLRFGNEQTLAERGFVYLGPGLADLSVAEGWQAGGEPLTLSLVDFAPDAPIEVRLGTGVTTGTPTGFLATSAMTVTTPYTATNGVVDLELVQFAGQPNEKRVTSPGAWLARAPQVIGATPANAYQGGGETVSLALAGFRPGELVRVELGSAATGWVTLQATPSGTLDQSSLSFVMPLAPFAGQVDVVAIQDAGGASELRAIAAGAFTVVGASIASLSPTSGPLEGGTTVVVQTSGFQEGVAAQVTLGGATVAGVVAGSGASQTVTFRTVLASASGPSDVNITQGVFNAVLPSGYAFDAARVIGYCTAKLTGQGTLPVIGFSGSPSVTTGDFAITLSNALPNKTAQYFYGTTASNFPLFGGFLCAGGGVVRGPLTSTNASSAAATPFPVLAPLVGSKRYFQWWFRDPLDPAGSGRGLSAGLEVEFYN
jgi:hypothetical protein